jgi:hypothetical protein
MFTQLQSSSPINVPKPLTAAQIKSFVDDGFLVIPDLAGPSRVEQLKTEAAEIACGKYPCEGLQSLPRNTNPTEVLHRILCIHQPHYISPVIEAHVRDARICGVLSQITAAHLAHWDGSVKCMQSMLFVKPPGFQGQAWHQDEIYIPTRDRSLIGAWTAIDDATVANGCLWVLPGSHRSGILYPQRPHGQPEEFDNSPESYGFDDAAEVPVEVKAGSVVFFNGYLLHRSKKNRSNIYRRALVNHYMNAWSLLPWDVRAGESPANADRRAVQIVAGIDPYAWKGYEKPPNAVYLRLCKANTEPTAPAKV